MRNAEYGGMTTATAARRSCLSARAGPVAGVPVTGGLVSLPGQLFQIIYHPIVTTLVPATAAAGSAAFTLTVQGGQFMGSPSPGATEIYIDGVAVATTYVGQTQVTCQVTPPAAAATQQVTVRNGPVTTSPVTNLPLTFT